MTKKSIDDLFFLLFCEKNSDGTQHLRLKGREMSYRIGRRLNAADMYPLAEFLNKYPEVISMDISYNDLQDEGVKVLAQEFFNEENNLQDLNLMHCDVHAEGLKWLSAAKHLELKKIRLIGNKLGPEGTRYIGSLIEHCRALELLDVGETDQTLESIESLLMAIEKSRLKFLNISRIIPKSYYSRYNNSELAEDLGTLLKINNTLETLMVQKCEFDGHDVELLVGGLTVNKSLTMLDIAANRIGDHGAEILAKWLITRPTLISLKMGSNAIKSAGARALSHALPFSRVRLLDINNNSIDDQGLQDIFASIKKSTQMRILYIWGNKLGNNALKTLERLLKTGVLNQKYIDVTVSYVNGKPQAVYYPVRSYTNRFYAIMNSGASVPPKLKIVRNKVPDADAQPRALINFNYINRYPPVDESLGLKPSRCQTYK